MMEGHARKHILRPLNSVQEHVQYSWLLLLSKELATCLHFKAVFGMALRAPAPPQNHCNDTVAWSCFGFRGKNELRRGEAGGAMI